MNPIFWLAAAVAAAAFLKRNTESASTSPSSPPPWCGDDPPQPDCLVPFENGCTTPEHLGLFEYNTADQQPYTYIDFQEPGECMCVGLSPSARCDAIRNLVRPAEVIHLLHPGLFDGFFVENVGRLVKTHMVFKDDPPDCDRFCSPARSLHWGYGDCDDHAVLALSILLAGGVSAWILTGLVWVNGEWVGHAWIEGVDDRGSFHLEATSGDVGRDGRPPTYHAKVQLHPSFCLLCA